MVYALKRWVASAQKYSVHPSERYYQPVERPSPHTWSQAREALAHLFCEKLVTAHVNPANLSECALAVDSLCAMISAMAQGGASGGQQLSDRQQLLPGAWLKWYRGLSSKPDKKGTSQMSSELELVFV